jgi:hypothetical protein
MLSEVDSRRRDELTQPKHPYRFIKTQLYWVLDTRFGRMRDQKRTGKDARPVTPLTYYSQSQSSPCSAGSHSPSPTFPTSSVL